VTPETRALAAFVASAIIRDAQVTIVRDQSRGIELTFSADVRDHYLAFYDYARSCPISGSRSDADVTLFDYGTNSELTLTIDGTKFGGRDGETSSTFAGEVDDTTVRVFDHQAGAGFTYVVG
jgi:hypothetical protein